jgi:Putative metal-binding motif
MAAWTMAALTAAARPVTGEEGTAAATAAARPSTSTATVDCDDSDPLVYPGADETLWNDTDDDCDGVVDADGAYSGDLNLQATAVYEGENYSYLVPCAAMLNRGRDGADFTLTCTPDLDQALAEELLGANVTVTPSSAPVSPTGADWSGSVDIVSATGWDTRGTGSLSWAGADRVTLQVGLDAFSLDLSAQGELTRE